MIDRTKASVSLAFLISVVAVPRVNAWAATCSNTKRCEILQTATQSTPSVKIDCDYTPPSTTLTTCKNPDGTTVGPKTTITKRLIFEGEAASHVTFDCKGNSVIPDPALVTELKELKAVTVITSSAKKPDGTWSRPHDVLVTGCNITGRILIKGASIGLEPDTEPATDALYTALVQDAAPTDIHFDRVNVTAISSGDSLIWFGTGVTYSSLTNSSVNSRVSEGLVSTVPIYITAESQHNVIRNNDISVETAAREQIAIDGSADNLIVDNRIVLRQDHGGIFVYRNCGENGGVRVQKPQHNQIINNYFEYDCDTGNSPSPAIWVASRMRTDNNGVLYNYSSYCSLDYLEGWTLGSAADDSAYSANSDNAKYTVAAQNQFLNLEPSAVMKGPLAPDVMSNPFYKYLNEKVSLLQSRNAGCFLDFKEIKTFIQDSRTAVEMTNSTTYATTKYSCNDGDLTRISSGTATIQGFSCAKEGSNAGCTAQVTCPSGKYIAGIRAACNLETTTAPPDSYINGLSWSGLSVYRESDVRNDGKCLIENTVISTGTGTSLWSSTTTKQSVGVRCQEYDVNGGDCVIKGQLLCY